MKLKINGRIFATMEEVIEEVIIDLNQPLQMSIDHNELFTDITVGDQQWYFEKDSVKYQLF